MLKILSTNKIAEDILMFEISVFIIDNSIAKIFKLCFYEGVASLWNLENQFLKAPFLKHQEYSSLWKIVAEIHEVPAFYSSYNIEPAFLPSKMCLWVSLPMKSLKEEKEWNSQTW